MTPTQLALALARPASCTCLYRVLPPVGAWKRPSVPLTAVRVRADIYCPWHSPERQGASQ
jgi:hypothetical protein